MTEFKFQAIIVPENYDYSEEEIVYRIFFDEQLISERSLPILQPTQGIVDTFYIKNYEISNSKKMSFVNCKEKKCILKKFYIDGKIAPSLFGFNIRDLKLVFN